MIAYKGFEKDLVCPGVISLQRIKYMRRTRQTAGKMDSIVQKIRWTVFTITGTGKTLFIIWWKPPVIWMKTLLVPRSPVPGCAF